jgi:large subunit ribosomal protein L25
VSITVECQKRPEGINPRALRRDGLIPAALYGHNGAESVSLTIDAKEAIRLLKAASINNTLIDLKVPEISWNGKALIREVQSHPWKRTIYHLSFFSVSADSTLELVVPVTLVGTAAGVKLGGVMEQMITELNISCTPDRIPETIEINVTNFEAGSNLHVRELVLPEGVKALDDPESMVFSIVASSLVEAPTEEAAPEV